MLYNNIIFSIKSYVLLPIPIGIYIDVGTNTIFYHFLYITNTANLSQQHNYRAVFDEWSKVQSIEMCTYTKYII